MATIYDVTPSELIEKVTEELKKLKEIEPPSWAIYVKTGMSKERPPANKDWWYIRAAAVLRTIYRIGPLGVSKLRTKYGSKKNRGHKPEAFFRAGGNIFRKILQQLEKAGLVRQVAKQRHKGRVITPKGKSLLDKTASLIVKSKPVKKQPEQKKVAVKPEVKGKKTVEKKEVKKAEEKPAEKEAPKTEEKKVEAKKEEPKKEEKTETQKSEVKKTAQKNG